MKLKKTVIFLVLALFVAASLISCVPEETETPKGFLLANNPGADYNFYYPETWLLDRHDGGMTSAFVSENDFSSVSVTTFTASMEYPDLLSYAENYYLKQFGDNFQNLQVEKNQDGSLKKDVLKIDSCDALSFRYSSDFAGENYSFRTWLISRNGYIYTVLYTAKTDLFDAHLEEAAAIAENIRFR